MNILLISQCQKRALTETRRILDQFGERKGERTWQTPITQIGLDTLRKMLRASRIKSLWCSLRPLLKRVGICVLTGRLPNRHPCAH